MKFELGIITVICMVIVVMVLLMKSHKGEKYDKPEFDLAEGRCINEVYRDWGGGHTFFVFDNLDTLRIRHTRYKAFFKYLPHYSDSVTAKTN